MLPGVGDLLLERCATAKTLVLAAPYIKVQALDRILVRASLLASLTCVTRWRPHDLFVGVSDLGSRDLIMARSGSFRLHPSLHAKYYRADDCVLVGSANLTLSALGWVPQPNLEILSTPSSDFDHQTFEAKLLSLSREVSDSEFALWDNLARSRFSSPLDNRAAPSSLDAWRPVTRDPRNLILAYRNRISEVASPDEHRAVARDLLALAIPPGLTDASVRAWLSTCLLASPFASSVLKLGSAPRSAASASLADLYSIDRVEARRAMETVQSWLAFLRQ